MRQNITSSLLLLALALVLVPAASPLSAKTIFVNERSATPASPYGTWATATDSLQDAIASAVDGDQIWVAKGSYYPDEGEFQTLDSPYGSFQLKNGIEIYGGFAGDETLLSSANPAANPTILSGEIQQDDDPSNNTYHIILATNVDASTRLHGLTIQDGSANELGAGFDTRGGGLYCFQASPTLTNCHFLNNSATTLGGAVYNKGSSPTFTNCSFKANQATTGGAMANDASSSPELTNVEFLGNKASQNGGALFNQDFSAPSLLNCSLAGNLAALNGGAVYNANNAFPIFQNSIIWNNQKGNRILDKNASVFSDNTSVPTYIHCLVQNYTAANLADGGPNVNYDSTDPLFISTPDPSTAPTTQGNLGLRSGSPALDAGSNPSPEPDPNEDLAGNARLLNETIDLGAYEGPYYEILSWELGSPVAIDAPSVSVILTISSGTLPTGWEEVIESAGSYYKLTGSGSGPAYTITLDGITSDTYLSLAFNKAGAEDKGFHFTGEAGIENIKHLSSATTRHYVVAGNEFSNAPYDNWANAAANLQDALAYAAPGDQVWVAAGTYYPDDGFGQTAADRAATFQLVNGVEIYGGFKGDETKRAAADPVTNPTILSGDIGVEADASDNSYHILTAEAVDDSTILEGFTITGGYADGAYPHSQGAALYCDGASPSIINCTFGENFAEDYGGAIYNDASFPRITNCSFQRNSARDYGGAIYNSQSSPQITNCTFQGNYSNYQAGALYNYESSPLLTNCTFQGNKAKFDGGAIHNSSSSPSLVNCIIWSNESKGATHTAIASISSNGTGSATFSSCLVDNYSKATLDAGTSPDTNLPPTDPRFILPTNPNLAPTLFGDLRLRVDSPAIDEGDTAANSTAIDLAGNPRLLLAAIDLGAYEGASLTVLTWDLPSAVGVDATSLTLELTLDYEINALPEALLDAIVQSAIGTIRYTSITTSGSGFKHNVSFNGLSGEGLLTVKIDSETAETNGILFSGDPDFSLSLKSSHSKTHYVNLANENSEAPYDTWETASDNLQDALAYAVSGDQIWIAKGTYYPDIGELNVDNDRGETFLVKSGISIYGGFAGGETDVSEANSNINFTTLSGEVQQDSDSTNNSYHVLTIRDTNDTIQPVLEGLDITSGYANGLDSLKQNRGGALYCFDASPQLIEVYFYYNYAEFGGAVYNESESSPSFTYCRLFQNSARSGGAVYNKSKSSPSFYSTALFTNTANEGGAIYNDSESSPELTASFITGNLAELGGGGIFNFNQSAPILTNCLIRGNRATNQQGGGIKNDNSSPKLFNCSFQGNRAGDEGGAIYNYNTSSPEFVNCIIWNNRSNDFTNQATSSVYNESGSVPSYSFCIVENYSKAELDAGASPNTNFIPVDPLFVKPAVLADTPTMVGDLSLKYGSFAIDTGSNPTPFDPEAKDYFGNDRIQNSTIDLGPIEGAHITATAWQQSAPLAADAAALVVKLTLDGGIRPSTWKNAIKVSTDGSATTGGLTVDESDSNFVLLVLAGLSGEGKITLSLDPDLAEAEGLIFLGEKSFETLLRSSTETPTHYVNAANTNGEAPYDTWEKAAANLQDALAYAATGDEVWVAQGTYYPDQGEAQTAGDHTASFKLQNGIAIYGGFAGGETGLSAANPFLHETILSGDLDQNDSDLDQDLYQDNTDDNSYHVVTAESTDETAQLHGFTITGGNAFVVGGDIEMDKRGGGLYCKDASPTLTYCLFQGNRAYKGGGAIYNEEASPKLTNCSFQGNYAHFDGGAINNQSSSPAFTNCAFQNNYALERGGAIYNEEASPSFTNCTFQGNYGSSDGGAIYNDESSPSLANCIIWDNGVFGVSEFSRESIGTSDSEAPGKESTPIFSFCIVENYSKADLDAGDSPNTNLAPVDPLFVNPTPRSSSVYTFVKEPGSIAGLRLRHNSPALDKGTTPSPLTDFDLAGNPRLINEKIDLGAYEGSVFQIKSWTHAVGASTITLILTLEDGAELPTGWEDTLKGSTTGTAAIGSEEISGNDPVVITLSDLSGDGKLTLGFDKALANAKGFTFEDYTTHEVIVRTSTDSNTLYVNAANSTSQAPYSTWETAANKLQDALDYAIAGDEVWVAKGTYYPDEGEKQTAGDRSASFNLKSDVGIYGGFEGGETLLSDADPAANFTTLSGDIYGGEAPVQGVFGQVAPGDSYHVVLANATNSGAILNGFIITGGYADFVAIGGSPDGETPFSVAEPDSNPSIFSAFATLAETSGDGISNNTGGGLYCVEGATPTISNCWFEGNFAHDGGAIGNKASSPNIVNCTFKGNFALNGGGAIHNYLASAPTITNSSFQENTAIEKGGAIYNDSPAIDQGGVISFNPSTPVFINCSLQGNSTGGYGGAVYNERSTSTFANCSFQGNKAVSSGGAIANDQESSYTLKNSIIWDNQAFGSTSRQDSSIDATPGASNGTFIYTNSLVENYSKAELDDYSDGANSNLPYADPLFVKETSPTNAPSSSANLRLRIGSTAIDAGKNADNSESKDLAGNARLLNSIIDLGAYEGGVDSELPVITLIGKASKNLPFGKVWTDPGATVTDNYDAEPSLTIGGDTVDSSQIGETYTLTYDSTDSDLNQAIQLTRTVTIVNPTSRPVIVLAGDTAMSIAFGATWTEPGATATDATGAAVTVTIAGDTVASTTPGASYTLTYNATDIYGNVATQLTRTVTTGNPTSGPVIVLAGNASMSIAFGATWTEPGATATDATGAAVTVTIAGDTVASTTPGAIYTVTYNATDSFGNAALQVTRTVTTGNPTSRPVIVLAGDTAMSIAFGATWTEPGATATDATGAAVTVTIAGDTVDASVVGASYTLTYNATDSFGNAALQVTRQVIISGVIDWDGDGNNKLDQFSWTDDWILQTSTDLKLWTDVPGAQSPLTIPTITEAQRFWRLRQAE